MPVLLSKYMQVTCTSLRRWTNVVKASCSFAFSAFLGQILLSLLLDFLLRCNAISSKPVVKVCLCKEAELVVWLVVWNRATHHQLVKIASLQTKIGCCLCCGQERIFYIFHMTKFALNFLFYAIPNRGFQTSDLEWFFDCKFRHIFRWSQVAFVCFSEIKQKRHTADNEQYDAFEKCGCVVNV